MLDDVVVLELGERTATGVAGRILRDLGATVIRVESANGDPRRRAEPAYTEYLHGGKQSITEDALDILGDRVDAIIHDDSAPALAHLTRAQHRAPDVPTVAVSDFGLSGPYTTVAASELTLQAEVGIVALHPTGANPPVGTGVELAEITGGLQVAQTTVTALIARDAGASPVTADVSLFESLATLLQFPWLFAGIEHHGVYPTPQMPVPGVERARDGWVCVVSVTDAQWASFKKMAQIPELDDPRFDLLNDRVLRVDEITPLIRRFTERYTIEELVELGVTNHVPIVPVTTAKSVTSLPPYAERESFVPLASGRGIRPRAPFRFEGQDPTSQPLVVPGNDNLLHRLPGRAPAAGPKPQATATKPLTGIRVVEFGTFHAGPLVTANLAALGAEVIKIEAVGRPDLIRFQGVAASVDQRWERSAPFTAANLGKRDITADLGTDEGLEIIHRLLRTADVVVENFLPRVLKSRGLDAAGIRAINPAALVVRMPAWGLDGPWKDRPGFTYTVNAASGLADLTGYPNESPLLTGTLVDALASAVGTTVSLAAIYDRTRTGEGAAIEVPLCDVALQLTARAVVNREDDEHPVTRSGNRVAGTGPRNVYSSADDRLVAVDAEDPALWGAFAALHPFSEWAAAPELAEAEARRRRLAYVEAETARSIAAHTADYLVETLRSAGIPAALVETGTDLTRHPQLVARSRPLELDHPVIGRQWYLQGPAWFTAGPCTTPRSASPLFGADTRDVLEELGFKDAEINDLVAVKLIGDSPFGLPYAGQPTTA